MCPGQDDIGKRSAACARLLEIMRSRLTTLFADHARERAALAERYHHMAKLSGGLFCVPGELEAMSAAIDERYDERLRRIFVEFAPKLASNSQTELLAIEDSPERLLTYTIRAPGAPSSMKYTIQNSDGILDGIRTLIAHYESLTRP